MVLSFNIKVVTAVLIKCSAIWLWKLSTWSTEHIIVEQTRPIQLTADDMLYVLGESSDNTTVKFQTYLQYVRSQILNPSKSRSRKLLRFTRVGNRFLRITFYFITYSRSVPSTLEMEYNVLFDGIIRLILNG